MKLIIAMPEKKISHDVAWLELNTPTGNYVIQEGHVPMILALSPEKSLTYRLQSGKQETIIVRNGIATISRESTTIALLKSES